MGLSPHAPCLPLPAGSTLETSRSLWLLLTPRSSGPGRAQPGPPCRLVTKWLIHKGHRKLLQVWDSPPAAPLASPSRQHHPWEGGQGRKRPAGLGGMLSRGAVKRPPGRRSPLPKGGAAPAAGRDWDLCHFQMKFLPPVLPRVRRVEAVAWRGSTSPPATPHGAPGPVTTLVPLCGRIPTGAEAAQTW